MAFSTGTATNYVTLFDALMTFIQANGWTVLRSSGSGTSITDVRSVDLRGPGTGADRRVFVSMEVGNTNASSLYWWRLTGATAFDSGISVFGGQPNGLGFPVFANFWTGSIKYWFYVNDRRFIVVAQSNTQYSSIYAGFYLPFGTPEQYPFPLYIGADDYRASIYTDAAANRRHAADPGAIGITQSSAWMRDSSGLWIPGLNHDSGSGANDFSSPSFASPYFFTWPYHVGGTHSIGNSTLGAWHSGTSATTNGGMADRLVATRQGGRPIWPVHVYRNNQQPFGALDGYYFSAGIGLTSEQALTASGRTFRLFQNLMRNSSDDFFAVEEI